MRKTLLCVVGAAAGATAAPVAAQIWIGQIVGNMIAQGQAEAKEHACMMGTPVPSSELEETREPTSAVMTRYATAVAHGPANVLSAWHEEDRKARWTSGKQKLGYDKLVAISDPYLASGANLDATPRSYLRSGDGSLVEGLWVARDTGGSAVGVYDAVFTRQLGVWRLRTLTLLAPNEAPENLVQYCHKTGDVEPYKVAYEERQRRMEAKRAAKAAAKAAREAERAAKAGGGN